MTFSKTGFKCCISEIIILATILYLIIELLTLKLFTRWIEKWWIHNLLNCVSPCWQISLMTFLVPCTMSWYRSRCWSPAQVRIYRSAQWSPAFNFLFNGWTVGLVRMLVMVNGDGTGRKRDKMKQNEWIWIKIQCMCGVYICKGKGTIKFKVHFLLLRHKIKFVSILLILLFSHFPIVS